MILIYYNILLVVAMLNRETAMCNVPNQRLWIYQELSPSSTLYPKLTEAATRGILCKKVFLEISQN